MIDGTVSRQATLISFDRVLLLAGIAFLFVLPLLFFLKVPEVQGPAPKIDLPMDH